MGYMKNTVRSFIDSGYALASINYRYSTDSVFPAQIRDCNQAIEFLYQHASTYNIDKNKIAVIGFSAGGHLASLLALSNNNNVKTFHTIPTHFTINWRLIFMDLQILLCWQIVPILLLIICVILFQYC
jgi:dipeptidyl aminopeptidase/acylaminoacyl peptidase